MKWFTRTKSETQAFEAFDGNKKAKQEEDWGIIGLRNDGNGVPSPILVKGAVKCVICQGFTEDRLVCEDCQGVVTYLRAADNLEAFVKLMEFAAKPGMLAILELLIQDDMITELLMQRMKNARNRV